MTTADWHVSRSSFSYALEGKTPLTIEKGATVLEIAENILGYRINPAGAASAMGAWLYAKEDLQIAESFLGLIDEVWPEY